MSQEKQQGELGFSILGPFHVLAKNSPNCPKCSAPPSEQEVRNYDEIWRDGDVYCKQCNTRVRDYDAG